MVANRHIFQGMLALSKILVKTTLQNLPQSIQLKYIY
jgi:hypothetical protein